MRSLLYILLSFCILLTACEAKLERENIPLWLGIQLEAEVPCPAKSWQANQQLHKSLQPQGWTVEVPIFIPEGDSGTIRMPSHYEIKLALTRLESLAVQTCLHFSLQNPFRVRGNQIQFDRYTRQIDSILTILPYSPDKLMFSGFWIQDSVFQQALIQYFPKWKKRHPHSTCYIAGRHESLLADVIDWEGDYELAVIHDAPPDEVFKPYFRKVNGALSEKALKHNRSLFIAQSNLLGEQKLLLFKNQLRFWDEQVVIEGLTINSLYCTSSLADSSTRFGLAKDKHLMEYVKNRR